MLEKSRINKSLISLCMIAALLLSSCVAATEVPIPTAEPPQPAATEVNHISTQKPYTIQNLNDSQLLSSTGGAIIWESSYLTFPEPVLGVVSSLPLNIAASNFVLYTEFAWDSTDSQGTACGVTFRDSGRGDYYMSLVRKNGDGLLWLALSDQWQVSPYEGYGNYLNSGNNEINQMILIAENETITLIVNDTIFYQAVDSSLSSGNISLVTGTGEADNTCTFQNSWIWEIDGTSPAPQVSNSSEPIHDVYAGYTGDSDVSFLIVHPDGEKVGVSEDAYSSIKKGIVWVSPNGESVVVYVEENELPKITVVGEYTLLYSNYTNTTVDITIIHPDGKREVFRAKYSAELAKRIAGFLSPSLVSVSFSNSTRSGQIDFWDTLEETLFAVDVATCIGEAYGLSAVGLGELALLAHACHGPLIEWFIIEGQMENKDVGTLETISVISDRIGCAGLIPGPDQISACLSGLVNEVQQIREEKDNRAENIPAEVIPTKRGNYP